MKTILTTALLALFAFYTAAQTPATFKLNLEKNKKYTIRVTSDQNTKISVNGQEISVGVKSRNITTFKVLKQTGDVMDIEFSFDTIMNKTNSPAMSMETNSAKPGKEPLEKIMNRLSGNKLTARISTDGKFIGFVNFDQFRDNIMMVLDSVSASRRDEAKKIAESVVKESSIQSMVAPFFAYLPEKPVKVGDTWENTYTNSANNISFVVFNTYNLKALDKKEATISGTSELQTIPSTDPNAMMSMEMTGKTSFDGTMDPVTGLATKTLSTNTMEGTMTTKANGNEMKMPMKIEGTSETVIFRQ